MSKNLDLTNMNIIRTIISDMEGSEDRERRTEAFDSWQIYSGNQYPYVLDELKRTRPKSYKSYTVSDVSVAKMVTDKKAQAYKEQPIRDIEQNKEKNERLMEIYKEGDAQRQLAFFDTALNLHKYSLMWVNYNETYERYQFMTLQGYEFALVMDKDTGDLLAVILNYGNLDITANSASGDGYDNLIAEDQADSSAQSKVYAMWSKENHVVVKVEEEKVMTAGGEKIKKSITYVPIEGNPNQENFLGIIPFVYISKEPSIDYPTKNPLSKQSVVYNTLLSELLTAANIQGSGVSTLKYPAKMEGQFKKISTGITSTVKLPQPKPEDGAVDFSYVSPSPQLAAQKDSYLTYLKQILAEHNIGSSEVIDGSVAFNSGIERAIAQADVQAEIEKNQELYVKLEKQIFEILKAYEQFMNSSIFKDEDKLTIKFKKPKVLVSDKEILENIEKRLSLGLMEKWEALVVLDPNLSEEDAREKIEMIEQGSVGRMNSFMDRMNGNQQTS